jgi:hypothetical protein
MPKLFVLMFALLAATILAAQGAVGASAPEAPDDGEAVANVGTSAYYLKSRTGTGPGGANQDSSLTVACAAEEVLLGAGYASVDQGTKVTGSSMVGIAPEAWRVEWRNNATPDDMKVSIVCGPDAALASNVLRSSTTRSDAGGQAAPCPSGLQLRNGGFRRVDPTSTVNVSSPVQLLSDLGWQLGVTPSGTDTYTMMVICGQGAAPYSRQANPVSGAPNGTATFTVTCDEGDIISGVGFSNLEPGTHLKGAWPVGLRMARFAFRNDSTPNAVTGQVVCLNLTP